MSPELLLIYSRSGTGEFNPEKSDIFSTGLAFLRFSLLLDKNEISEMNTFEKGEKLISSQIIKIKYLLYLLKLLW